VKDGKKSSFLVIMKNWSYKKELYLNESPYVYSLTPEY
jgi:hypothetical protein